VSISTLDSQSKADYQWIFGSDALLLEDSEGSILDFNGDKLKSWYQPLPFEIGSNNASICDENGKLLFYTNGCAVFDSTFQIMENGDGINEGQLDGQCDIGNYPGVQNSIILPVPNNSTEYYYLHKSVSLDEEYSPVLSGVLCSKVSFADNDLGSVLQKNIEVDPDRNTLSGFVESILHQNSEDWWVIDFTQSPQENFYLAYLIDQDTITLQQEIEIDNTESLDEWCAASSQSCFTPDGTKLAKMCPLTGFDLWDFDRSTGVISNYRHLTIEAEYHRCGVGISPNSRFAYLSCADSLWQVDLWEEDLSVGLELIDTLDLSADPSTITNFGYQQLGPDCKIYMNTIRQYDWLHVINKPDEKGKACDFSQHSIKLPHLNQPASFPNFPHFRIDEDAVCDPTITSVFGVPIETVSGMEVFPNPTSGNVTVELPETVSGGMSVKDLTSQVVLTQDWEYGDEMQVDLSQLNDGMYLLEVYSDDGRRWVERVVVVE
jgi:hypothetical protein